MAKSKEKVNIVVKGIMRTEEECDYQKFSVFQKVNKDGLSGEIELYLNQIFFNLNGKEVIISITEV